MKKRLKQILRIVSVIAVLSILLFTCFCIPASAQSLSFAPSDSLIKCWSIEQGSNSLTHTYYSSDSSHFDKWNVSATLIPGSGSFLYVFRKNIGLSLSAGEKIHCKFPLYFNNNGVNSSGENIDEYLWTVSVVYSCNGAEYVDDVSLGIKHIDLGIYDIDFTIELSNNCDEIRRFYFTCHSSNGEFYKTTWGSSGFRALIGVADDIQILTGDDIPKYAAPDGSTFDDYSNVEQGITDSNQAGLDKTVGLFQNFGSLFNDKSSIMKGLLAVTNIFNEYLNIPSIAGLLDFSIVLGIFAFLLGMATLAGKIGGRGSKDVDSYYYPMDLD